MAVFRLFEKRSTKFESLYHEQKYLEEENWQNDSSSNITQTGVFYDIDWEDRPQNYEGFYGILQLLGQAPIWTISAENC